MCPNGKHVEPPRDFEFSFDVHGNSYLDISGLCTTCPLFIGQLLKRSQPDEFRCYRKYINSQSRKDHSRSPWGAENYDDPQQMAIQWLAHQGITPVSRNSGRKANAKIAEETKAPYHEILQVIGDNEDTWRKNYQPGLRPSGGYKVREQSLDPDVATAFHKRFRTLCGRDPPPVPPPTGMSRDAQMMFIIAKRLGLEADARKIYS